MNGLIIGIGLAFLALRAIGQIKSTQTTPNTSTVPANTVTPSKNTEPLLETGNNSSFDLGQQSGNDVMPSNIWDPAESAQEFANWVNSIQVSGYPQQTGVIDVRDYVPQAGYHGTPIDISDIYRTKHM